jgi:hypothetical protein
MSIYKKDVFPIWFGFNKEVVSQLGARRLNAWR